MLLCGTVNSCFYYVKCSIARKMICPFLAVLHSFTKRYEIQVCLVLKYCALDVYTNIFVFLVVYIFIYLFIGFIIPLYRAHWLAQGSLQQYQNI